MSSELVSAHRAFVPGTRGARRLLALSATCAAASLIAGCFDSQWGEEERAQRRLAAHMAPPTLAASTEGDTASSPATARAAPAAHVLRARLYVTPSYAAQTLDSARQVRELVDDANAVLATAVGARIEVEATTSWAPPVPESSLLAVLDALRASDKAEGVDLVVGFIGGLSSVSYSFHELGMAPINGKHLVVRAASRSEEHDAVESAFTELHDDERARLRKDLKRHRATAVFLHEIGHALGAIHETEPRSVMHFQYAREMAGFRPEGAALMRIALAHRSTSMQAEHPDDETAWATELRALLQGTPPSVWAAKDLAEMQARVEYVLALDKWKKDVASSAPPVAAQKSETVAAPPAAARPVGALQGEDANVFARAAARGDDGSIEEAWKIAGPLFAKYPSVYEVQDLRCKLAMKRQGDWTSTRAECDPLMRISVGVGKK